MYKCFFQESQKIVQFNLIWAFSKHTKVIVFKWNHSDPPLTCLIHPFCHLYLQLLKRILLWFVLDEAAAKEEARINIQNRSQGFTNADVVVKLGGSWDPDYSKSVAQATLSALKQLILSDKKLPGAYFMLILYNSINISDQSSILIRTNGNLLKVRRVFTYAWDAGVIGQTSNLLVGTHHLERVPPSPTIYITPAKQLLSHLLT